MNTGCKALAEALHAACVALGRIREELDNEACPSGFPGTGWIDLVGQRVALAIASIPDSVLRAWLMDDRVIGGHEVYKTLRAGCEAHADVKHTGDAA